MHYVLIHQKPDTLPYVIFHSFIEIGIFIYTKSMTLCVTYRLYIQKSRHLEKEANFHYVFIYKKPDTLHNAVFHEIFEIGGGGGLR